jgi:hypothetical protein
MGDIYFFDLPVYRLPYETYNADQDREVAEQISNMKRGNPGYEPPEATKLGIGQHQHEKYGPWRFNEIIGYIRLHFLGSQIRGEYFSAEKKRNPLGRHRVFTYRTHKLAPELSIHPTISATNAEIFEAVKQYVVACKKELTKGRVIDDSILMTIGPHMDWRGLLGWEKS